MRVYSKDCDHSKSTSFLKSIEDAEDFEDRTDNAIYGGVDYLG